MSGAIGILVIVVVVILALLGAWRGLRRELLVTLAGIFPGALLGEFWSQSWGRDFPVLHGTLRLAGLGFVTLCIGYGSALFLSSRRPAWWEHLAGAGVGLLNGLLLTSISLRYVEESFYGGAAASPLRGSPIAAAWIDYLPWLLAVLVGLLWVAVVAVGLVRLYRSIQRLVQVPAGEEVVAGPPPAAPLAALAAASPEARRTGPAGEVPAGETGHEAVSEDEPHVPCPNCGKPVPFGAAYCPQCGKIIV